MKKLIISATLILSTGALSSQTKVAGNNAQRVMVMLHTSADKKDLASAD